MHKCDYGCDGSGTYTFSNGKYCCSESCNKCPGMRKKNSLGLTRAYLGGKKKIKPFSGADRQRAVIVNLEKALSKAFCKNSTQTSGEIKRLAIKGKKLEEKCGCCSIDKWQNKPILLELHHIDGDGTNNELGNLQLLCPNCHSQTDTWRGKNVNSGRTKVSDEKLISALKTNASIRKALQSVGLAAKGGNYTRAAELMSSIKK